MRQETRLEWPGMLELTGMAWAMGMNSFLQACAAGKCGVWKRRI